MRKLKVPAWKSSSALEEHAFVAFVVSGNANIAENLSSE